MKDYKHTLNMPKTEFAMRGNLGQREADFQKRWDELQVYPSVLQKNKDKPFFVLHDGPPYANGDIHIGHALNKILKDFVVRYKNMSGFKSPYVPGWDTHGLPIETALTKKGIKRNDMSIPEYRRECANYAMNQIERQKEQFKRLGILGNWDNPYVTLHKRYEGDQIRVFAKMVDEGLIYKGLKPVYWSPSSETALAEAEIEYHDKQSPSIYAAMPLVESNDEFSGAQVVIWTTTPWTLPGNLAIAVGKDIDYVLFEVLKKRYIVAKERLEVVKEVSGFADVNVIMTVKGTQLTHLQYHHPLYDRVGPIVLGHHVTTEDGTGLVHIAPGHGEDDFIIGRENNLEVLCPVDAKGIMTEEAGPYAGEFYDKANISICNDLKEKEALLALIKLTHAYPHDWRTKKPVIFRATPQWFASIDALKEQLLGEIKNVKWFQRWGELRIHNMIKDRQDWCISRQRTWGVPIPILYTEDGNPIMDQDVLLHIANIFEKEGSNAWYERSATELLPVGYTHPGSPNQLFEKETDIMDVWFDSGSSHRVLERYGLPYPADLYLEGSDQYRGWFNSSLVTSVALSGFAPYKQVVSHGFVLDLEGRKMSKSLGNVVDPIKIMNQLGADILRLWVASVEYQNDVRISENMMKQISESYRKIRNTIRFLLGNLYDFNPRRDAVPFDELSQADRYMRLKMNTIVRKILQSYDNVTFDDVNRILVPFIINELSAFYLDFTKDILYIESPNSKIRRGVQTVYHSVLLDLLKLLAPILPHTTSEAYWELPGREHADIYLEEMPKVRDDSAYKSFINDFEVFMELRDAVLKELEEARSQKVIGKSLNAKIILTPSHTIAEALNRLDIDLAQLFIVSDCEIKVAQEKLKIKIEVADGETCARCWIVTSDINQDDVCPRCAGVLKTHE